MTFGFDILFEAIVLLFPLILVDLFLEVVFALLVFVDFDLDFLGLVVLGISLLFF